MDKFILISSRAVEVIAGSNPPPPPGDQTVINFRLVVSMIVTGMNGEASVMFMLLIQRISRSKGKAYMHWRIFRLTNIVLFLVQLRRRKLPENTSYERNGKHTNSKPQKKQIWFHMIKPPIIKP